MTTGRQERRKGTRYDSEGTTGGSRRRCVSSPRYVLLLLFHLYLFTGDDALSDDAGTGTTANTVTHDEGQWDEDGTGNQPV